MIFNLTFLQLSKCMEKYQEKEAAIAKRVCEIDRQSAKFEEVS